MAGLTLPESAWRDDPAIQAVVAAIGDARFVGGCVRDAIAGHTPTDVDLATSLVPELVIRQLELSGIKAVPTGLAHGTITAVSSGRVVEVTTLRRDVSTDGRRATVAFTEDWREDAARRDFTINALYADPTSGEVYDWFGGIEDLQAGIVRFIGEPLSRIAEDHLRILRFFRFYARYGIGDPDPASLSACTVRANDLMALSRERIADELLKILSLDDPSTVIALMIEQGIFAPVLPEIVGAQSLERLVPREAVFGADPIRRLASLLQADERVAEDVGARLKLSNAQRKRLIVAAGRSSADNENPRALAYWNSPEGAVDRLLLGDGDVSDLIGWEPPVFPISGGAIVARGVRAGPDVARILNVIERQWVDEGFPDVTRVEQIADIVVAKG